MKHSVRPVLDADAMSLDLYLTIPNEVGDGGVTLSADDPSYVQIEFAEGLSRPMRAKRFPCTEKIRFDILRGGSTAIELSEGTFRIPLSDNGSGHESEAFVAVVSGNEIVETLGDDNEMSGDNSVSR